MMTEAGVGPPQLLGWDNSTCFPEFSHEVKLQLSIVVAGVIIHLELSHEFSHFLADVSLLYK